MVTVLNFVLHTKPEIMKIRWKDVYVYLTVLAYCGLLVILTELSMFRRQKCLGNTAFRCATRGAFAPQPKFSKHCIAILTFAETFKE